MNENVPLPPPAPAHEPAPRPLPTAPAEPRIVSPGAAVFLSFLPGLGHVYLGLYERAMALFVAFFAAVTLAGTIDNFGLVAAFVWFFGPIDAYRQARLINLARRRDEPPGPASRIGGRLGFGVFLTLVGTLLLLDRLFEIDLSWLADWWPAFLVAAGLYLIVAALLEARRSRPAPEAPDWETPEDGEV